MVELSRLGRNTRDLGRLLDHLDDQRVGLQILNLGIDPTTPAGRLIFTIIGAGAAMEREPMVERTQFGLSAAAAWSVAAGGASHPRSTGSPALVRPTQHDH